MKRRDFVKASALAGAGLALSGPMISCTKKSGLRKRVLVLGIDGMDPGLLQMFLTQGKMPNFQKLLSSGGDFKSLKTTLPPQSPVAWASFITGNNPGKHGIFDFIHRDPKGFPADLYLSTSRTYEPKRGKLRLGKWMIPFKGGDIKNLVSGTPFWNYLTDAGISSTIFRAPSNFPPFSGKANELSGMGTPDILGTYGTFSYYTDNPPENAKEFTGGEAYPTFVKNGVAENFIYGPSNTFRLDPDKPYEEYDERKIYNYEKLKIPFKVYVDPENSVAKIVIQGKEIFLKVGEWSNWVQLKFELIPHTKKLYGICKFYLKELKPDFKLYVSPVNIDPKNPALPIFNPAEYGAELTRDLGFFYTQGISEDTKARTYGVLNDQEYWTQSQMVGADWFRAYRWHLDRFKSGFLFFYFSTLDLGQHMFFRFIDEKNPLHQDALKSGLGNPLEKLYQQMDHALGLALEKIDQDTTLVVISDHGFAGFNRCFNVNSWLLDNGYAYLIDPDKREKTEYFDNVDWGRTRAYGLGINGLYLNMEGREGTGIVKPEQTDWLLKELKRKLEAVVDPATGEHPIKTAYITKDVLKGKFVGTVSPDIIIGYRRGYRASWDTTLGEYPKELVVDNKDPWSGDHCIDPSEVPASVLANKKIAKSEPGIWDIGPSVLKEFGIKVPGDIEGEPVF